MNKFIETERLILTPIASEHCTQEYLNWLNDAEVNKYLESGVFPTTLEGLRSFVSHNSNDRIFLAIILKENGKHIGNIKIDQISPVHKRAEYGILMGDKDSWGKGYAYEASVALVDHCFKKLNLNKVTLGVVEANQNAIALYKKMGFKEEGLYKSHSFHDGKFHNVVRMAVFAEDWNHHD